MMDVAAPAGDRRSATRAWTTVIILTLLYCLATLDRQIVSILVMPIKADLSLTDVQVGLVQGAFSLFFTVASLPIGWLIDRARRKLIVLLGTLIWSMSSVATGFAGSFTQLFAVRAAVGAGEASLQPTAFTIMGDLFPPGRLTLPLSLFVIGANIGNGASYILGGAALQWLTGQAGKSLPFIGHLAPWQQVFVLMGLPGLILAFAALAIDDHRRTPAKSQGLGGHDRSMLRRHYARNARFLTGHHMGFAMCLAFAVGLMAWNPAYLNRQFGWGFATIGLYLGGTQILSALIGLTFHGWMIDRLYRAGRRNIHVGYFVIMAPLAGCLAVLAYNVHDAWLMLLCFNLSYFCLMGYPGAGAASLQIVTPAVLRGRASAIYLIILNLVGAFGGPLIVALITDYWFRDERNLGSSMAVFSALVMAVATLAFLAALRSGQAGGEPMQVGPASP